MQKELNEILDILKAWFETEVPQLLIDAGLDPVEKFLAEPCDDVDEIQMSVIGSDGNNNDVNFSDAVIVNLQLPSIDNPVLYQSALYKKAIKGIDPKKVGATTKETNYSSWYPGEISGVGSSSFVIFEIRFSGQSDDCELDY